MLVEEGEDVLVAFDGRLLSELLREALASAPRFQEELFGSLIAVVLLSL